MGKTVSITDIGRKRKLNQDYVFIADLPVGKLPNLYLVADGMGGHNAGGFASRYAVETIVEQINRSQEEGAFSLLYEAIEEANFQVRRKALEDESMSGMGTTLVAATIEGDRLQVANVGDSRLYLVGDTIRQITTDHSLVEEMVRSGRLTPEQAKVYPGRNLITRAIGVDSAVEADLYEITIHDGQTLLLCSDGLSGLVYDAEIAAIVAEAASQEEACNRLIERACEAGGNDNITVVLYTK